MLSGVDARGREIADAAQRRAIARAAEQLQAALPDLDVQGASDAVVLSGRIAAEDVRLRWIGSLLT